MIKKIENGDVSQVAGGTKPGIYQVLKLKSGHDGMVVPESYPAAAPHTTDELNFLVKDDEGNLLTPRAVTEKAAREVARLQFGKDKAAGYYATTGKWTPFEN